MYCSIGRKIRDYIPYQYSQAQMDRARDVMQDANKRLICRVALVTIHILLALGIFFLEMFLTLCQWMYGHIRPINNTAIF